MGGCESPYLLWEGGCNSLYCVVNQEAASHSILCGRENSPYLVWEPASHLISLSIVERRLQLTLLTLLYLEWGGWESQYLSCVGAKGRRLHNIALQYIKTIRAWTVFFTLPLGHSIAMHCICNDLLKSSCDWLFLELVSPWVRDFFNTVFNKSGWKWLEIVLLRFLGSKARTPVGDLHLVTHSIIYTAFFHRSIFFKLFVETDRIPPQYLQHCSLRDCNLHNTVYRQL